jgi:hypothetical protein
MIFTLARLVTACDDSKLIRIERMNIRSNHFRLGGKHFDPISAEVDSTWRSERSA